MNDLLLKASELAGLIEFVDGIPTKWGHPIKVFIADTIILREKENNAQRQLHNSEGQTSENIGGT